MANEPLSQLTSAGLVPATDFIPFVRSNPSSSNPTLYDNYKTPVNTILSSLGLNITGQCRLTYVSATSIKLIPYNGNTIMIAGQLYNIPSAGITIANTGLGSSTLYYVYLYLSGSTLTLYFSTTGHATDTATGVEIISGNSAYSLVGMIRTDGNSQFQDSNTYRGVASWFNRRSRRLNGGDLGGYGYGGTSIVALGSTVYFLTWADETLDFSCSGFGYNNTAAYGMYAGIMYDGNNSGTELSTSDNANCWRAWGIRVPYDVTEGFHTASYCGAAQGGGAGYFYGAVQGVVRI